MFSLANPNMCVCVCVCVCVCEFVCVCEYPDIVLRALRTETVVNIAMMHSRNPGAKDCVTIVSPSIAPNGRVNSMRDNIITVASPIGPKQEATAACSN